MVSFPRVSPSNPVYTPLLSPIRAIWPAHIIHLTIRTIFGEQYRSLSSSLCSFLHSSVTPSLLGPNILLSTLISNTLSLCYSLHVSDQVSHPYKTTGKIIVLYLLIFIFLCNKLGDIRFRTEWMQAFPDCNLLLIFSWMELWFAKVVPNYLKCSTSSKDLLLAFVKTQT